MRERDSPKLKATPPWKPRKAEVERLLQHHTYNAMNVVSSDISKNVDEPDDVSALQQGHHEREKHAHSAKGEISPHANAHAHASPRQVPYFYERRKRRVEKRGMKNEKGPTWHFPFPTPNQTLQIGDPNDICISDRLSASFKFLVQSFRFSPKFHENTPTKKWGFATTPAENATSYL